MTACGALIRRHAAPLIDEALGVVRPAVEVVVGRRDMAAIREELSVQAIELSAEAFDDPVSNAERSVVVERELAARMKEMSPTEFRALLLDDADLRQVLGLSDRTRADLTADTRGDAPDDGHLSDAELRIRFADLLERSQAPEPADGPHPAFCTILDNLVRLGLVRALTEELTGNPDYEVIESRREVVQAETHIAEERNQRVRMVRGHGRLSRLGELLCGICLR